MDPRIRERWAQLIESGRYRQAISDLRFGNSVCVLGGLCEAAVDAGVIKPAVLSLSGIWNYAGERFYLPRPVIEWAGLKTSDPAVRVDGKWVTLSRLNDKGKSFPELAQLIRNAEFLDDSIDQRIDDQRKNLQQQEQQ